MYSLDEGVAEVRASLSDNHAGIMQLALGDDDVPNRAGVIEIMGQVVDSVSFRWVGGTLSTDDARKVLERSVKTLIP